jgi:hypothetical protein
MENVTEDKKIETEEKAVSERLVRNTALLSSLTEEKDNAVSGLEVLHDQLDALARGLEAEEALTEGDHTYAVASGSAR